MKSPETATIISVHKIIGTNIILAGHANYGILRSTDNGATWSESNKGTEFRGCSPYRFVQSGIRIFAFTQNVSSNLYPSEGYSYYSDDNGVQWNMFDGGVGFGNIGDTLFTGMPNSNYLARSTDNGTNWTLFIDSNLDSLSNKVMYDLTCSKGNIIVGTALNDGIYVSQNKGMHFVKSTGVSGTVRNFYTTASDVYAIMDNGTIYKSSTGGLQWTYTSGIPSTSIYGMCNMVFMGDSAYAFNSAGLYSAAVSDLNFQPVSVNVNSKNIRALGVDGSSLLIGSGSGFFRSSDGGMTWVRQNSGLAFGDFTVLKELGSVLYAGTSSGEIFRSENGGGSWTLVNASSVPSSFQIEDITTTTGRIHVQAQALRTSTDSGKTWLEPSSTNLPLIATLICFESFSDSLFAYFDGGFFGGSGLFVSANGINFVKSTNNLPAKKIEKLIAYESHLVAQVQDSGIYQRTSVSGEWTKTLSGGKRLIASGNVLMSVTADSLIHQSTDKGATWTMISTAPYSYPYYADRVWKTKDSLYAMNTNAELFASGSDGASWKSIKEELSAIRRSQSGNEHVRVLGVIGGKLHFGVTHNGMHVRGNIPTAVHGSTASAPSEVSLGQNYPNPFNPTTAIEFHIPMSSVVKLTVYDVVGREVSTLVNEQLNAGSYRRTFNGAGFASGVYYYRVTAGAYSAVKRMIMLK